MLLISMSVMQEGLGYGIYFLILPFIAWMVVLVVSQQTKCTVKACLV